MQVFSSCTWAYLQAGMGEAVPQGLPAAEVLAVCRLLRIPQRDWPEVFSGVRVMVAAALPLLRSKEA